MGESYVPPLTETQDLSDKEIIHLLNGIAEQFSRRQNENMAQSIRNYLHHRQEYVDKHKGKYVQITANNVNITDKTDLEADDIGFKSKTGGLLVKIGHEIQKSNPPLHAMYAKNYNPPTHLYSLPVSFGNRNNSDMWTTNKEALVDTGCARTTLDISVLNWIENRYSTYHTVTETLDVVGGRIGAVSGTIDIDVCSVPYTCLKVNYAELHGFVALIGMDVLNSGKLDLECGTRLSFTHH